MQQEIKLLNSEVDQVIEILKTSDSRFVDIDCLQYPIRKIIGQSRTDLKMLRLKNELERRNILLNVTGYWSLAETPGFLYITDFTLTKEFFESCCLRHSYDEKSKQFKLF